MLSPCLCGRKLCRRWSILLLLAHPVTVVMEGQWDVSVFCYHLACLLLYPVQCSLLFFRADYQQHTGILQAWLDQSGADIHKSLPGTVNVLVPTELVVHVEALICLCLLQLEQPVYPRLVEHVWRSRFLDRWTSFH